MLKLRSNSSKLFEGNAGLIFSVLAVAVFTAMSYWGDYYYAETTMGHLLLTAFISYFVGKNFHWSVGLFYFYAMANGIILSADAKKTVYSNNYLERHTLLGMMAFSLHVIPFAFASKKVIKVLANYIPAVFFVSTSMVVFRMFFSKELPAGVINNTSIDPSMLAVCFGLAWPIIHRNGLEIKHGELLKKISLILCAIGIVFCKGSVGIGALVVSILCYAYVSILNDEEAIIDCILYLLFGAFIFMCAYYLLGSNLFNDSTRFKYYPMFIKYWWENANHFLGLGFSSFWTIGPLIQLENDPQMQSNFFTWFHSEWLQIIFELGFIGLALSLNVVYHFFKSCILKKDFELAIAGITYCSVMVFNIPLRFFLFSFLGILILRLGFSKDGNEYI